MQLVGNNTVISESLLSWESVWKGSTLGLVVFSIFSSDLDEGVESVLIEFLGNTEQRMAADVLGEELHNLPKDQALEASPSFAGLASFSEILVWLLLPVPALLAHLMSLVTSAPGEQCSTSTAQSLF